jgi:hypothetical protein
VSAPSAFPHPSDHGRSFHWIDPRGQRFGAGISAILLAGAFAAGAPWLAALLGLDLALSAAFGTRYFLPGRPWPAIRHALRLRPAQPEHDYPPRFAQALGATFIAAGILTFVAGATTLGWLLVLAVASLQTLLALTGVCVGCRLYVLRWWGPSLFRRLLGRTEPMARLSVAGPLRRPHA